MKQITADGENKFMRNVVIYIYIYIYIYINKIYFQEIKWRKQFQIQNYLFSENFYTRRFDLKKPSSVVL